MMYDLLGLDVSVTSTGVVLLQQDGMLLHSTRIRPGKRRGGERLAFIQDELHGILEGRNVALAAVEGYSYGSKQKREALGEAGGVVRALLYRSGVTYFEVAPTTLKLYVSGNGRASKDGMRHEVSRRWGFATRYHDIADAYGLAQLARSCHQGAEKVVKHTFFTGA